ncbi:hypothetical protein B0H14DRAFT_1352672 [Mycena olivaceomarginata]|nr:hypothetical protein B0H14DRAFT_1352672 [Mycena olivaceomarginata]
MQPILNIDIEVDNADGNKDLEPFLYEHQTNLRSARLNSFPFGSRPGQSLVELHAYHRVNRSVPLQDCRHAIGCRNDSPRQGDLLGNEIPEIPEETLLFASITMAQTLTSPRYLIFPNCLSHCAKVLVTGGSAGIGQMIAMGFARNGATVYIAARKEAQLKQAIEDIKEVATGKVDYIVANVGSKAGCDGLISEFKKRESKLHVLVNNSGITWGGPYSNFPEEKGWDKRLQRECQEYLL